MKTKAFLFTLILAVISLSCSKNIDYSKAHVSQTTGRYMYNLNDVFDVYYQDNELFLRWRGVEKMETVAIDENTFFVADMYNKLRFVRHPETNKRYLSIVSQEDEDAMTYDYLKVADSFKTPDMYLKEANYKKAYEGFLAIMKEDSTSVYLKERTFNRIGYKLIRDKKFADAIEVFKMNVALYPDSDNVYDSLADAYARSGDSLMAYTNYKKALELNTGNRRAKEFLSIYNTEDAQD